MLQAQSVHSEGFFPLIFLCSKHFLSIPDLWSTWYLWLLQAVSCPPLQNLPCLCLSDDRETDSYRRGWKALHSTTSVAASLPHCIRHPAHTLLGMSTGNSKSMGAVHIAALLTTSIYSKCPFNKSLVGLWVLYKAGWILSSPHSWGNYSLDACWKSYCMRTSVSIFPSWCPGCGTMMHSLFSPFLQTAGPQMWRDVPHPGSACLPIPEVRGYDFQPWFPGTNQP